mgnify:CR=1 FL=1
MKNLFSLKTAGIAALALVLSIPVSAQETETKRELRLNLVKEVDGEKMTLDTVFVLEPGQSMKDIELPAPWSDIAHGHPGTENVFEIEVDDEGDDKKVIIVTGHPHGEDHEVEFTEKKVWITEDGSEVQLLKDGQTFFIEVESEDSEEGSDIQKHVVIIGDGSVEVKSADNIEFESKGNTLIEVKEGSTDVFVVRVSTEKMTAEELDDLRKSIEGYEVEEDGLDLESLNVYPNPSNGAFSVSLGTGKESSLNLYVFNQAGQRVFTKKLKKLSGTEVFELDLTDQPAGVYYVNITDGNTSSTRKVVIE